ncbi:hypothetical protein BOX15_Mlig021542g1 [Macrostomum lignano]|uniref:Uncharacterized protein n=1 Tax=Macrostomum lignano TaxID=282301 RepID=A0A267DK99_9PLAT|nr:hypothetical protein BOX15_Mlig021542g1 [Macrostomum lignano]
MTTTGSKKMLRDETCSEAYPFYCYQDATAANRAAKRPDNGEFHLVEIKERVQPDPGCWKNQSIRMSRLECTMACLEFEFGDCVGFYWHPTRRQCVLLPYFDASLPLDISDFSANETEQMQWTKYRRTEF